MFSPLCERWSFCHDGLTRWRLLCGQHCGSSKAPRVMAVSRHGKLKIHHLLTKETLWRNHFTVPSPIYKLVVCFLYKSTCASLFHWRLNIPPLKMQDAAQGFRATQPNTGGTTTAFPCWKLRKSVDFLVFFPSFGVLFWDDRHAGFSFNMGWRSYWIGCSCHWHRVQGGINLQKSRISWPELWLTAMIQWFKTSLQPVPNAG